MKRGIYVEIVLFYKRNKFVWIMAPILLLSFPTQCDPAARYSMAEHKLFFSKYEGGVVRFLQQALQHKLTSDLLAFSEWARDVFDLAYQTMLNENTIHPDVYAESKKEFHRYVIDLWRHITTTVSALGPDLSAYNQVNFHQIDVDDFYQAAGRLIFSIQACPRFPAPY